MVEQMTQEQREEDDVTQYLVVVHYYDLSAAFFQKENGEWVVTHYADLNLEDCGDYEEILAICDGDTEWEFVRSLDPSFSIWEVPNQFEHISLYTRVV